MHRQLRITILALGFIALGPYQLYAHEDSRWRISPEKINIQVGESRRLQPLDDQAQELSGAKWSVDDPDLADIEEEDGHAVLHAKAVGTVRVRAALGKEIRLREIRIWPALESLPAGATKWSLHDIGRTIGKVIPSVPTDAGRHEFFLQQTATGSTYLRTVDEDGIQVWAWRMPEITHDVELICGDWLGGAEVSANRADSFTLYAIGSDGKLRWEHSAQGLRKALAISPEYGVLLISQSVDGTTANLEGIDERTGEEKFNDEIPSSYDEQVGVRKKGTKFVCMPGRINTPSRIYISRVIVNMDRLPYIAFTQNSTKLETSGCRPGSNVDSSQISTSRESKLVLWQLQPNGTFRSTVVETVRNEQPFSAPQTIVMPTGAIVTDNMNGLLLPVRSRHGLRPDDPNGAEDEFIYRIDPAGTVLYKLPVPLSTGHENDEMVIASNELGYATRAGILIAFNVTTGKDLWHWDSKTQEITVFAALANGGCVVQTPTELVEVDSPTNWKVLAKGKYTLDWSGNLLRYDE
jgi:outer membrane protein assembly factor BamB